MSMNLKKNDCVSAEFFAPSPFLIAAALFQPYFVIKAINLLHLKTISYQNLRTSHTVNTYCTRWAK
jgi:hypothetical protein